MKRAGLIAAAIWCASPAYAEVKSSSASHFEIASRAVVAASPAETFAMLGRIGEWWSGDHTYSGDAANMALELKAGGCFCEAIPATGGSVEHGRVVNVRPGEALRVHAALGPLQEGAVTGTLTWTLIEVAGGTEVTQAYVVSGYYPGGLDRLAVPVDRVMAEQLSGLQRRLAREPETRSLDKR